MNEIQESLTNEEKRAIAALCRLGKRWPKSLMIFAGGMRGLSIRKPMNGKYGAQTEVASAPDFPADGGDGGDDY